MLDQQPTAEHKWLQALQGTWKYESNCQMGPDQPPMKQEGTQVGRPVGEFWTLLESSGADPEGQPWSTQFTLGFDPVQNRFVGSFIASMMTHFWLYQGSLDADKNILTLDCEGPRLDQPGGLAHYQDIFEMVSPDHFKLRSQMRGENGEWILFMEADYRRT